MTAKKRFIVGGGGALMPVLISILAIDIGAYLNADSSLSTANIIGICIRYLVLFVIGGVVAYLHEDETSSFKLFELGVAAPALLTSLISAQGIVTETKQEVSASFLSHISVISSAHAERLPVKPKPKKSSNNFLNDVLSGISGSAYRRNNKESRTSSAPSDENVRSLTEAKNQLPRN